MFTKIKAFSLVEFSIVITIVSILLGIVLNFGAAKTDADKIKETKQKILLIEKALNAYFVTNQAIPCPADPSFLVTDNNFGIAQTASAPNNNKCLHTIGVTTLHSGSMVWGMVPVRSLNISDDLAFDAYGRRFSYVMIEQCNCNSTQGSNCTTSNFNTTDCGTNFFMTINSAAGTVISSNAILTIFSHGKDGHGAFPKNGGTNRIVSKAAAIGADELENSHLTIVGTEQAGNTIFVEKSPVFSSNTATYFDDIMFFWNKQKFITNVSFFQTSLDDICNIVSTFSANAECGTKTNPNCITVFNSLLTGINCFN